MMDAARIVRDADALEALAPAWWDLWRRTAATTLPVARMAPAVVADLRAGSSPHDRGRVAGSASSGWRRAMWRTAHSAGVSCRSGSASGTISTCCSIRDRGGGGPRDRRRGRSRRRLGLLGMGGAEARRRRARPSRPGGAVDRSSSATPLPDPFPELRRTRRPCRRRNGASTTSHETGRPRPALHRRASIGRERAGRSRSSRPAPRAALAKPRRSRRSCGRSGPELPPRRRPGARGGGPPAPLHAPFRPRRRGRLSMASIAATAPLPT